jgi:hypothetical protein
LQAVVVVELMAAVGVALVVCYTELILLVLEIQLQSRLVGVAPPLLITMCSQPPGLIQHLQEQLQQLQLVVVGLQNVTHLHILLKPRYLAVLVVVECAPQPIKEMAEPELLVKVTLEAMVFLAHLGMALEVVVLVVLEQITDQILVALAALDRLHTRRGAWQPVPGKMLAELITTQAVAAVLLRAAVQGRVVTAEAEMV